MNDRLKCLNLNAIGLPLYICHQITLEDIMEFEKKYKDTDEERKDVIQLYVQFEGNMDAIMESALCATQEDEPRICSIIQAAIDSEEVPAFPAFTKESGKKKKARRKRVGVI